MSSMRSFWCLYCWLWTYFTHFSSLSLVNFEEVNFCWNISIFTELIPIFSLTTLQFYVYSNDKILSTVLYSTHCKFSVVLHIETSHLIWFAVQIKWLVSIRNVTLGWNRLKETRTSYFCVTPKNHRLMYTP